MSHYNPDVRHLEGPVAVVSLACAALFLGVQAGPVTPFSLATKTLSVSTLALIAWRSPAPLAGMMLAAPLLASSAGDFFLEWDRRGWFVAGLGAFLVAHLLYIALFRRAWPQAPRPDERRGAARRARFGATIVVLAAGIGLTAYLWPNLADLRVPVTAYIAVLLAMAMAALRAEVGNPWVAAGAVLFVASDSMIGLDTFRGPVAGSGAAIWIVYYLAQVAITYGCLTARLETAGPRSGA